MDASTGISIGLSVAGGAFELFGLALVADDFGLSWPEQWDGVVRRVKRLLGRPVPVRKAFTANVESHGSLGKAVNRGNDGTVEGRIGALERALSMDVNPKLVELELQVQDLQYSMSKVHDVANNAADEAVERAKVAGHRVRAQSAVCVLFGIACSVTGSIVSSVAS